MTGELYTTLALQKVTKNPFLIQSFVFTSDIILDAQFMIYLILIYQCQDQPETPLGALTSSL